jgi:signal peptidase I
MRVRTVAKLAFQLALLGLIAFGVLGIRPGQVSGFSMEPRIDSDEYVLINALAYRMGQPHRSEIVAFRHERSSPSVYLKRVIGLPGERVSVDRGVVSVDGRAIDEPYVRFPDRRSFAAVVVPSGSFYVLGDNRGNSDDSRAWGFVPASDLIGRASFAIWPLSRFGALL